MPDSLRQIRMSYEQHAEGDRIRFALRHKACAFLRSNTPVDDNVGILQYGAVALNHVVDCGTELSWKKGVTSLKGVKMS